MRTGPSSVVMRHYAVFMHDILHGASFLLQGIRWWSVRPREMARGLVPAIIAFVIIAAGIITAVAFYPVLLPWMTSFADSWQPLIAAITRVAIGLALTAGLIVLAVLLFTALTLAIGEPAYHRIWQEAERGNGEIPNQEPGFWRAIRDSLSLILRGILAAVLAFIAGFVPLVGPILGPLVGIIATSRVLASELTSRALSARGIDRAQQRAIRKQYRGQVLGFGLATHLSFLIPLGAVVFMPSAVAGSTFLVQSMLRDDPREHRSRTLRIDVTTSTRGAPHA